jgi:hypothetical protein
MAFDPNVIGQIGSNTADIPEAIAKGFKLKDLVNQETLSSMDVQKAKKEQQQSEFLKGLSKEFDITKPEQASKAASKAAQAGYPDLATGVLKQSQSLQLGQADIEEKRFQIGLQAQTRIDEGVQGVLASVNAQTSGPDGKPLLTPQGTEKYDSKTKDAMTLAGVLKMKKDLEDDESMSPQAKQMALAEINKYLASGQPVTYDGINQVARSTKTGREAFDKEVQRRRELSTIETQQGGLEERKRHDLAMEAQQAKKNAPAEALSPQGQALYDELAARDQAFLSRLSGKGIEERNRVIEDWAKQGKTADQIIGARAGTAATKTEASVLGRREAAILPVEQSITKPGGFLDQAEQAVNAVDLPKLKAAGKFESWSKDQMSDPDLAAYRAAVAELRAEYSVVLSKGGQVTDAARHESEKVIPDLITPAQFAKIRQVVLNGIQASKTGVESSLAGVTKTGEKDAQATGNEPTATDAKGNKVVYRGGKWVPLGK